MTAEQVLDELNDWLDRTIIQANSQWDRIEEMIEGKEEEDETNIVSG